MWEIRLGDIIDDYCVKCKRIMNHAVVSMVNAEPAKVRCRTCHNDHDYRHEQAPPPKVDARKAALFNQVLAKVAPGATADPVESDLEVEVTAEEIVAEEIEPEEIAPEEIAPEEAAEEAPKKAAKAAAKTPAKAAAKSTAKAPAKTKGRK